MSPFVRKSLSTGLKINTLPPRTCGRRCFHYPVILFTCFQFPGQLIRRSLVKRDLPHRGLVWVRSCVHVTWIELQLRNDTRARVPLPAGINPKARKYSRYPRKGIELIMRTVFLDRCCEISFHVHRRCDESIGMEDLNQDGIEKIFLIFDPRFRLDLTSINMIYCLNVRMERFKKFKTGSRFNISVDIYYTFDPYNLTIIHRLTSKYIIIYRQSFYTPFNIILIEQMKKILEN